MSDNFDPRMERPEKKEGLDWSNEADNEYNSSEWFGAILRYFWHLGKRKFDTLYNPSEQKKNVLIGWLFKVILVLILIYIGYRWSIN